MLGRFAIVFVVSLAMSAGAEAQTRPPIIDMHLHALPIDFQGPPPHTICAPFSTFPAWDPKIDYGEVFASMGSHSGCANPIVSPMTHDEVMAKTLSILEELNIIGVTSGPPPLVKRWREAAPDRIIPGISFYLGQQSPTAEEIGRMHDEGRLAVLAEVAIQYQGYQPNDPEFAEYLAIAAEKDIPVGIHIGTGPPGSPDLGFVNYRARMHSPLSLEEPLLEHPGLRVYVMHAGWPMLDDTIALLYTHPQVYLGLGVISFVLPRAEFHRYLRRIVEAGFGNRIMFGSDQMIWPEAIPVAIESIESADFLSEQQKRDILYNNAARFLRLSEEQIAKHHGR